MARITKPAQPRVATIEGYTYRALSSILADWDEEFQDEYSYSSPNRVKITIEYTEEDE